ncbi:cell wall-binding repeat-containing protein [Pyrococcus sp. ST04]|uniref:cell wall-binding repeat-containing protein n=1 Tax=Pyrococcus sp. ST04 TaxID=1183377 RepID=UPI0002605DCD|nr:cell wall-binding repeat-containing protein [Pyrococcus sp. ST04]AFK23132.1 hypothetical protein Py04_1561 [Pyrococcus sp. ST04]
MRWVGAAGIIVLLIMSIVGLPETQAATQNIVILVSDNEADLTLAQKISDVLNATVVVTKWGVYNDTITAEISELNPDLVIIIGGPLAVVSLYEEELQALGINVTRVGGRDRVETSEKAVELILQMYPELAENLTLALAYGWDYAAMMQIRNQSGVIPLLVKNDTLNMTIASKFRNVEIVRSRFSEKVMERVREKVGNVSREIFVNITAERAEDVIKVAEERIELAKQLVENATIPSAEKLIEEAEKKLEMAKLAYKEGKYGEAFGLAVAAKNIAEVVIARAGEEFEKKISANYSLKLELKIRVLEKIMLRLKARGIDVSTELQLLEQAKQALNAGNVQIAKNLIEEIEKGLKVKLKEERESRIKKPEKPGRGERP